MGMAAIGVIFALHLWGFKLTWSFLKVKLSDCFYVDCNSPTMVGQEVLSLQWWLPRAPRQLLTGWVAHSEPNGCPEMTWGRTLKKALKCKGLPVNFKEWRAIAEDRSEWRSRTYSKLMPPSEN